MGRGIYHDYYYNLIQLICLIQDLKILCLSLENNVDIFVIFAYECLYFFL